MALLAIMLPTLFSCEDFHENNGDFGGMWQLTEWRTTSKSTGKIDSIAATNNDGLYYCVHQEMMQFFQSKEISKEKGIDSPDYRNQNDFNGRFFAYFKRTNSELTIYNIVDVLDNLREPVALKKFGVPADGKFKIEELSHDKMVLSYEGNILCFRKY